MSFNVEEYYKNHHKFRIEKIRAIPFQNKLWIVANLKYLNFIEWTAGGQSIIVRISSLDEYLHTQKSIFNQKDSNEFLYDVMEIGMEVVTQNTTFIELKHEYITRDGLQYLHMVTKAKKYEEPSEKKPEPMVCNAEFRMKGDLCFKKFGTWTDMQRAQAKWRIELEFNHARDTLAKGIQMSSGKGVPLPERMFKNPADTVMPIKKDSKYKGYYGDVDEAKLVSFFGDDYPKFEMPEKPEKLEIPEKPEMKKSDQSNWW